MRSEVSEKAVPAEIWLIQAIFRRSKKIEQMFDFPVDKHMFGCYIGIVTEQVFDGTEV